VGVWGCGYGIDDYTEPGDTLIVFEHVISIDIRLLAYHDDSSLLPLVMLMSECWPMPLYAATECWLCGHSTTTHSNKFKKEQWKSPDISIAVNASLLFFVTWDLFVPLCCARGCE
jgi:hypothetical protein